MTLDLKQLEPQVAAMAADLAATENGIVKLGEIRPSRWQPRDSAFDPDALWELAKSIRENGLINPIVVFAVDGGCELVAGERRVRAMTGLALGDALDTYTPKQYVERLAEVGLILTGEENVALAFAGATIPARIESADDLARLHRLAVVENLERENLNPLEEARALAGLVEAYDWSQRELADHLGKSQGWVAQRLGLLELPEVVQEAVSTRVITLTHARALQGIPEDLGPAVTKHLVKRVKNGATTREVADFTRTIKEFLDPEQYDPRSDLVWTPRDRNRLALRRWLLENLARDEHNEGLIFLARHGDLNNLASASTWQLNRVFEALGYKGTTDAWQTFAAETLRTCTRCRFNDWEWTHEEWDESYWDPPCKLWQDADATTCDRYIGPADPEIVKLLHTVIRGFDRLGIEYEEDPFNHIVGVAEFVECWGRLQAAEEEWETEEEQEKATAHIAAIERFYNWALSLPLEATDQIRAHVCAKCAYRVLGPDGPCYFVKNPMLVRRFQGQKQPRAPEYGAFVTREGLMLPRCEMFTYANRLPVKRVEGTVLVNHEQAVDWLRALAGSTVHSGKNVWAILQWMDYGRMPGESGSDQDLGMLVDHLLATWFAVGSNLGEEFPTLLDVVASEARPTVGHTAIIELVNPVTGDREQFVPLGFRVALGEHTWPGFYEYPDGWPRPWLDVQAEEEADEP